MSHKTIARIRKDITRVAGEDTLKVIVEHEAALRQHEAGLRLHAKTIDTHAEFISRAFTNNVVMATRVAVLEQQLASLRRVLAGTAIIADGTDDVGARLGIDATELETMLPHQAADATT